MENTNKPENTPAFPTERSVEFQRVKGADFAGHTIPDSFKIIREGEAGMTLRDYFATHMDNRDYFGNDGLSDSIAKLIMGCEPPKDALENLNYWLEAMAKFRYKYADAMLAERSK